MFNNEAQKMPLSAMRAQIALPTEGVASASPIGALFSPNGVVLVSGEPIGAFKRQQNDTLWIGVTPRTSMVRPSGHI
jgi:hypothetical protein